MPTRRTLAVLCMCFLPAGAFAQEERGATVGGSVSAANMESHTDVAFAGAFGYRFSRVFGMEIEATVAPTLKAPFPNDGPIILNGATGTSGTLSFTEIYPGPTLANPRGRLVIFSTNARVAIPTTSNRVTPYFVAGGGIASIRRTAEFTYRVPTPFNPANSAVQPELRVILAPVVSASTELALTIGGGVDVRVMKQLSVEVDLRLFRLLGQDDRNVGRFGIGVRQLF